MLFLNYLVWSCQNLLTHNRAGEEEEHVACIVQFSRAATISSQSFFFPNQPNNTELNEQLVLADTLMPRWMQLVDPGIGFSKGKNSVINKQ